MRYGNRAAASHPGSLTLPSVQRFCRDVVVWKSLSHPNVLGLIGVPDTFENGRFSIVSKWMTNGTIVEYVRAHAGYHLKLVGYSRVTHRYILPTPSSSRTPLKD